MAIQVASMYWNNIEPRMREGQRRVFDALQIPLQQLAADQVRHGIWMNRFVEAAGEDDVIVFFDIDAFALTRGAFDRAVEVAQQGGIFGLAQTANHRPQHRLTPYAGPMFMAFAKRTWRELGQPDLRSGSDVDAAQRLSLAAQREGRPLDLLFPGTCLQPRWALGHDGVFGIGTFYGSHEAFHLFESRESAHLALFDAVADDVASRRPLDFTRYLEILQSQGHQPARPRRRRWWRLGL